MGLTLPIVLALSGCFDGSPSESDMRAAIESRFQKMVDAGGGEGGRFRCKFFGKVETKSRMMGGKTEEAHMSAIFEQIGGEWVSSDWQTLRYEE